MVRAIEVARYLLRLAESEDEPDRLSNLRLQKLLYYVQGWSLAQRGRPMFSECIEAWEHGPAVPVVYRAFKRYGHQSIPSKGPGKPKNLTKADCEFIEGVWSVYGDYSASSLRKMTHEEAPWKDARGDCGPTDACRTEITKASIQRWFREVEDRREVALAEKAIAEPGENVPWEKVRTELGIK